MDLDLVRKNINLILNFVPLERNTRRALMRALRKGSACFDDVVETLLPTEDVVEHYQAIFEFVSFENIFSWIENLETTSILRDDIAHFVKSSSVAKDLDHGQRKYTCRLLYELVVVICRNSFKPKPSSQPSQPSSSQQSSQPSSQPSSSQQSSQPSQPSSSQSLSQSSQPQKNKRCSKSPRKISRSPPPRERRR